MRYFAIFISVLMFIFPQTIWAQSQSFSFSLIPSEVEIISSRNKTIPLSYTLTNTGDPTVITVKVYRLEFTDSQGNYKLLPYDDSLVDFPTITTSASLPGSIPDEKSIILGKPILMNTREAIEFELITEIGSQIPERDFYIALIVESVPSSGFSDTNHIFLQGGMGALLYISVSENGSRIIKGSTALFDVKSPFSFAIGKTNYRLFDSYQEVPLILRFANQGDRLFRISGQLLIANMGAPSPQSIDLQEATILAGTQRNLVPIDKDSYPIRIRDGAILIPGSLAGITTIHSFIRIGEESSQHSASISYITFPFRGAFFLLGALCISALLFLLTKYVKGDRK